MDSHPLDMVEASKDSGTGARALENDPEVPTQVPHSMVEKQSCWKLVQRFCDDVHVDYATLGRYGLVVSMANRGENDDNQSCNDGLSWEQEDSEATSTFSRLELQRVFGPSHIIALLLKLIFFAWGMSTMIQSFLLDLELFWVAYLTHWTLCLALVYQLSSLLLSIASLANTSSWHLFPALFAIETTLAKKGDPASTTGVQAGDKVEPFLAVIRPASVIVKGFWSLFSLVVTMEVYVAILFWVAEGGSQHYTLTFQTYMVHGGVCALLFVDGFFVNRIPIRLKQIGGPIVYSIIYTLWTLVHDYGLHGKSELGGNPDRHSDNPQEDDDSIYYNFSWVHRPQTCTRLAILSVLVYIPILYLGLWLCSHAKMAMHQAWCDRLDVAKTTPVEETDKESHIA